MDMRESIYEKYHSTTDLLKLQKTEDELCCEDELSFQIVPQICELHFKLILQHLHIAKAHLNESEIIEAMNHLRRLNEHVRMVSQVTKVLEYLEPIDFHTIRLVLSNGSGSDSPGFNLILKESPTLWEPFSALLNSYNVTLIDLHQKPRLNYNLFLLLQELINFDQEFKNYRYQHMMLVRRMIGLGSDSLKGAPAKMLEGGMRHEFFPALWEVINELTAVTGSSYSAKV